MGEKIEKQKIYWDRHYKDFDNIYTHKKSGFSNFLDRIFRWDMYERYKFALKNCEPISGKTILDVGCGSGHYCVAFAKKEAKKVTGIDISENMIRLSQELAKKERVEDICDFINLSIEEFPTEYKYDFTLAIGIFDYIRYPLPVLRKLNQLTKELSIMTFPRFFTWRAPLRKLRLLRQNCDVYFYSKLKVNELLRKSGFDIQQMEKIGNLYCVAASVEKAKCDR